MTRLRFTQVERGGFVTAYAAVIELDGSAIGTVQKLNQPGAYYRARIDGKLVATGRTLPDLRAELREFFSEEYEDAKESW